MSITYKELYQKVLLRLPDTEGKAVLSAKEAVNMAHKAIARVQDFDELLVLNMLTIAGNQRHYHLTNDLGLVRPKDLYTIRCINGSNSRKLARLTVRELDEKIPYVEGITRSDPQYYIRRGMYLELVPIPDKTQSLYIYYSQWPVTLKNDNDESSYETLDDVIITLATDIAFSILEGTHGDWDARAKALLSGSVLDSRSRPDRTWVARPFNTNEGVSPEPWADPFIKSYP